MPGIARVTTDSAGGVITGNLAPTVFANGANVAVLGCSVSGHGEGSHASPTMSGSSSNVYAGGIKVCRQGDSASCGHTATGSNNVFANGS